MSVGQRVRPGVPFGRDDACLFIKSNRIYHGLVTVPHTQRSEYRLLAGSSRRNVRVSRKSTTAKGPTRALLRTSLRSSATPQARRGHILLPRQNLQSVLIRGPVLPTLSSKRSRLSALDSLPTRESDTTRFGRVIIRPRMQSINFACGARDTLPATDLIFWADCSALMEGPAHAAVAYETSPGRWVSEALPATFASTSAAELAAIVKGVDIGLKLVQVMAADARPDCMHVFSDEGANLAALIDDKVDKFNYMHTALAARVENLKSLRVQTCIHWVKGHSGVLGNWYADYAAWFAAREAYTKQRYISMVKTGAAFEKALQVATSPSPLIRQPRAKFRKLSQRSWTPIESPKSLMISLLAGAIALGHRIGLSMTWMMRRYEQEKQNEIEKFQSLKKQQSKEERLEKKRKEKQELKKGQTEQIQNIDTSIRPVPASAQILKPLRPVELEIPLSSSILRHSLKRYNSVQSQRSSIVAVA